MTNVFKDLNSILNAVDSGEKVYFQSGEGYDPYIIDVGTSKEMKKKYRFRDSMLFGHEDIVVFDIHGGYAEFDYIEIIPTRFYTK